MVGNDPPLMRFASRISLPCLVLAVVAAVHGVVFAGRLPSRLVMADEANFYRMAAALAVFAAVQGVALPVWGAFADRFGRRRAMLYSLSATIVVCFLGYAPLMRIYLPNQFVFAAFGGLFVAGLPLAASYVLSLIKEGPKEWAVGVVVSGFFAGGAVMLALRMTMFSLPREGIPLAMTTAVLLFAVVAVALVVRILPDTFPTTVSYAGMNALHGLWHGFAESCRSQCALWWQIFLGCSGLASGVVAATLLGFASRGADMAGTEFRSGSPGSLVLCLGAAAAASLTVAWPARRNVFTARRVNVGAGGALLLTTICLLAAPGLKTGEPFLSFLCGAATGSALVSGLGFFAAQARQRSGGAELGAVAAIWIMALLSGTWLSFVTFKDNPQIALQISAVGAVLSVFTGFMATRRLG